MNDWSRFYFARFDPKKEELSSFLAGVFTSENHSMLLCFDGTVFNWFLTKPDKFPAKSFEFAYNYKKKAQWIIAKVNIAEGFLVIG